MQHGHGYAAWTYTCSMDIDMQYRHGHGHAAWTLICSIGMIMPVDMDMDMQNEYSMYMDINIVDYTLQGRKRYVD